MCNQKHVDTVSVKDFDAAGDGAADDTRAVQAAFDSGARHVRIPAGVFVVSNAIRPHSGQSMELCGTLKVADAHIQPLIADAVSGDDSVEVADAGGFREGQWVTLCAEDSPKWQTRLHADSGRIVAIEGRRLRLDGRLSMAYKLQARPRIATQHSAIWLDNVCRVRIYGSGVIDGNKAHQIDVRPTALVGSGFRADGRIGGDRGEEIRAACGIAASGAPGALEHIVIEGITVRDASEHNLCLTGLAYGRVLNTVCTGARDKNITLLDSRDCLITGNLASFSEHEDGIMFHQKTGNSCVLVQGNICMGNPRIGIAVGFQERDIHLSGNLCVDNACNLSISGMDCSSRGDTCRGENYSRFARSHRPYGARFGGTNTLVANLSVSGDRLALVEVMGENLNWIGGSIRGTRASADNVGIRLGTSESFNATTRPPARITIRGVDVAGCHAGLSLHGRMEDVVIAQNSFWENDCAVNRAPDAEGRMVIEHNTGIGV